MNPEKWVFGAILLLLVLFFGLGNSTDTITPTRPIKDDDILVSDGETFTLGFFSTKNETSNRRYVGIWYNKISEQTVVWVANRDNPINGSSGAISINQDGNLVIYEHNSQNNITTTLWQTNVSTSSSYSAQLLDSGNLMLLFQGGDTNNGSVVVCNEEFSVMYGLTNASIMSMIFLDESGYLQQSTWDENSAR
ncbi:G-type lectin S-receptor-like serine/threonine-protein kinase At1g11300 [Camellia sinensis]|uniref:G-type lectin S-receptor-like serine/threonine-protein kinase At1g11300 n=1 Tax=Camellia sinensis TaxID=4442 RepID=UPI0010365805|nr:G-type lectin S-receptor-like serine/threonine-protein kinase At1g11300 [Camellia sinensis]